jgi:hypothetical protein
MNLQPTASTIPTGMSPTAVAAAAAAAAAAINANQLELPVQLATAALMAHTLRSQSPNYSRNNTSSYQTAQPPSTSSSTSSLATAAQQQTMTSHTNHPFGPFIFGQISVSNNSSENGPNASPLQSIAPTFRQQQPPPMKVCFLSLAF